MSHNHHNHHGEGGSRYTVTAPEQEHSPHRRPQAYDQQDEDNMAEIEREMALDGVGGEPFLNEEDMQNLAMIDQELGEAANSPPRPKAQAPPAHQHHHQHQPAAHSAHAAEFWFPECRSCSCCQGFKHGCPCVKTAGAKACTDPSCMKN